MARARVIDGETTDDPFMVQFDKGVGLVGYGLLFASPFMVGLPAMAGFALSFAHRHDVHPMLRTHYRFQTRIFWTAAALFALAIGFAIAGGGMEMTTVMGFVQARWTGVSLPSWMVGGYSDEGERAAGNGMLVAAIICALAALGWLMLASLWGFFKLVLGRPIGQRR
jgi:uncharacterized membrane protein